MKKFLIIICVSLLANYTNAQLPEPAQGLLSPIAAGLGKYGDFGVSYYTGAVDISIPLYNFSANGIDLPITLRYDASGVRVNALPSWVGQNWTLLAGGAITRVVRGVEDEYTFAHEYGCGINNIYKHSYFSSYSKINQIAANPANIEEIVAVNNVRHLYDLQPDIFIFNFMGTTGKFFLGSDGNWKIESDFNIDVIFDINNTDNFDYPFIENCACSNGNVKQAKSIAGFKLRDGNGNTYTFGYNRNATEYYINMQVQVGLPENRPSWRANCWYLTEVRDKFSNIVYKLEYQRKYHIANLYPRCQLSRYKEEGSGNWIWVNGVSYDYFDPTFAGDLISPVYLKTINDVINSRVATFSISVDDDISFGNGNEFNFAENYSQRRFSQYEFQIPYLTGICEFSGSGNSPIWNDIKQYLYNHNTAPYEATYQGDVGKVLKKMKLSSFSISNTNGNDFQVDKMFTFSYDDNVLNKGRIFLSKITESGRHSSDGYVYPSTTGGEYKFEYRKNTNFPDYMSYKTDHWGYYNGTSTKQYHTADGVKNTTAIYSAKETNPNLVQNGLLETIIYPTKGKTVFKYERHDYSKILADNGQSVYNESGLAGGVRIKQISNYDNNGGLTRQRNFYYSETKNGTSSGQLAAKPKYYWQWKTKGIPENNGNNHYSIVMEAYQITSVIPLSNSFGTHIGYSCVIEEELQNGYTKYKYDNFSDIKDDLPVYSFKQTSQPSLFDKRSEKTSMLGRIRKKEIYNANNQLAMETTYNYDNINTGKFAYSSNVELNLGQGSASYDFKTGDIYKLYYIKHFFKEEITKEYLPNAVTTSTLYTKNDSEITTSGRQANIRVLSSKETTNSNSSVLKEQYTYPFQLTSNSLNSNFWLTILKDKFLINQPIETKTFYNNQLVDYKSVEYGTPNGTPSNIVAPIALWTSKSNPNDLTEETRITAFNVLGKAKRITNRIGATQEVIWGGQKNELMLAIVENPPANVTLANLLPPAIINFQNGSANNETALINAFNDLRNAYPDSKITSYTYLINGILKTITDPRGITTYFKYDGLWRLIEVYQMNNGQKEVIQDYQYHYSDGVLTYPFLEVAR